MQCKTSGKSMSGLINPPAPQCQKNLNHYFPIQVLDSQPVMPVEVDWFENLLASYSPALKTLLVDSFRISNIPELPSFESPNLQSALENPDIVSAKLMMEIEAGRVVGPFKAPPFPRFRTLPLV